MAYPMVWHFVHPVATRGHLCVSLFHFLLSYRIDYVYIKSETQAVKILMHKLKLMAPYTHII